MPMLHGCGFPGCSTFTLSTYCVQHELLVRALKESERASHVASAHELAGDVSAVLTRAPESATQEPATL